MRQLAVRLLFAVAAVPCTASAAEPEPVAKGRPRSAWIADLKSKDADVRFDAAIALSRLGAQAAPALPELIGLLKDPDRDVQYAAKIALGRIGKPAVAALVAMLSSSDPLTDAPNELIGFRIGSVLARIGEPAVAPIMELLRGPDVRARRQATWALRLVGKPAVPTLAAALKDIHVHGPMVTGVQRSKDRGADTSWRSTRMAGR
jgi:HEAT repeat protein